jgi:hypothetical protein
VRSRGYRPSPEHKRRTFSAPHPDALAGAIPPAAALRAFKPPTMDQGRSSACGPHGFAVLAYVACAAAGQPLPFVPSPRVLYADTRSEEQPGDGPLEDSGVSPADLITAAAREGVSAIRAPTPDGRFSDVTTPEDLVSLPGASPPNVALRPTLRDDEESGRMLMIGAQELQPLEPDFARQMAASIAMYRAGVGLGLHATPGFEAWGEHPRGGLAYDDYDNASFTHEDGHFVALLDYRTELDGSLSFWLQNSWGEAWGESDGGIWVSERWLRRSVMEAWRVRVRAVQQGPAAASRRVA